MKVNLHSVDLKPEFKRTDPNKITFDMLTRDAQTAVEMCPEGATYIGYTDTIGGVPRKNYPLHGPLKIIPIVVILFFVSCAIGMTVAHGALVGLCMMFLTCLPILAFRHIWKSPERVAKPLYAGAKVVPIRVE